MTMIKGHQNEPERKKERETKRVARNKEGWKGKRDEEIHGRVLTTCIKIKIEVEQKESQKVGWN